MVVGVHPALAVHKKGVKKGPTLPRCYEGTLAPRRPLVHDEEVSGFTWVGKECGGGFAIYSPVYFLPVLFL